MMSSFELKVEQLLSLIPKKESHEQDEIKFWDEHWKKRIKYMKEHKTPWQLDGEWQRALYKRKIELFNMLTGDVSGKTILEPGAGCGIVSLAQTERGADVHLVELSDSAIQYLHMIKEYLGVGENAHITKADLFELPFEDNTFDVTWNSGVVEHYDVAQRAITEMTRVTKPGGQIIVAVPNLLSLELIYNALRNGRGTEHYFSRGGLYHFLDRCGLKYIQIASLPSILPSFTSELLIRMLSKYEGMFECAGILFYGKGIVKK